jgi:hypothetical protein
MGERVSTQEAKYIECWPFPPFYICTISIFLPASLVTGTVGDPNGLLVQSSKECTPPDLSTGISNLLRPLQAEVVLGQLSMNFASWVSTLTTDIIPKSLSS